MYGARAFVCSEKSVRQNALVQRMWLGRQVYFPPPTAYICFLFFTVRLYPTMTRINARLFDPLCLPCLEGPCSADCGWQFIFLARP